jgi:hypothetical protein
MTDKTEAMDNLIAQDADLIEICPDDLVKELRHIHRDGTWSAKQPDAPHPLCVKAANRIKVLTAENERLNKSAECLAESRRLAVKDVAELEAEIERLREALQFYAEAKNWAYVKSAGCNCVDADSGDTARAALEQTK